MSISVSEFLVVSGVVSDHKVLCLFEGVFVAMFLLGDV